MWNLHRGDQLPGGMSPQQWLAHVMPESETSGESSEELQDRCTRCQALLEAAAYDVDTSLFASDSDQPAGLMILTAAAEESHLELVAVRHDQRRRGLATALLQGMAPTLARRRQNLLVRRVSSREPAMIAWLAARGFVGKALGSLRMWRQLNGDLPRCTVPPSYELRPLRSGEEGAWVELKNDCFPESPPWQLAQFHQELSAAACFDFDRILVATRDGHLAGTTIAWEADYGQGPVGLIHWVGVHPRDRGAGLGRTLNTMALAQLAQRGYTEAWLNTSRDRVAAVSLYESLGFNIYRELDSYELPF